MPFELLGEIFRYLCLNGPLPLRHALCVSKSFYNAAVHNAYLWSIVSLDVQLFEHFRNRTCDEADAFLEQCLRRSGTLPLHLKIDLDGLYCLYPRARHRSFNNPSPTEEFHIQLRRLLQTFGQVDFKALERCVSLVWYQHFNQRLAIAILESLPKRLPSLQYLYLSQLATPSHHQQFLECPMLKSVHLSANYCVPPQFWGTNFTRAKTLTFEKSIQWTLHDIGTLSLFPSIQHLNLSASGIMAHWCGGPKKATQVVQFLHLRTLRVIGIIPGAVLARLEAPALEGLYVEADYGGYTSIMTLHDHYPHFHCSKLYALLPPITATVDRQWSGRLEALANKCSRLEVVYVSGWMEAECEGMPHCTI